MRDPPRSVPGGNVLHEQVMVPVALEENRVGIGMPLVASSRGLRPRPNRPPAPAALADEHVPGAPVQEPVEQDTPPAWCQRRKVDNAPTGRPRGVSGTGSARPGDRLGRPTARASHSARARDSGWTRARKAAHPRRLWRRPIAPGLRRRRSRLDDDHTVVVRDRPPKRRLGALGLGPVPQLDEIGAARRRAPRQPDRDVRVVAGPGWHSRPSAQSGSCERAKRCRSIRRCARPTSDAPGASTSRTVLTFSRGELASSSSA